MNADIERLTSKLRVELRSLQDAEAAAIAVDPDLAERIRERIAEIEARIRELAATIRPIDSKLRSLEDRVKTLASPKRWEFDIRRNSDGQMTSIVASPIDS